MEESPGWDSMTFSQRVPLLGQIVVPGTLQLGPKTNQTIFRDEDCVHTLGVEYKYEWNDVKCSDCHQYICKKGMVFNVCLVVRFWFDK